MTHTELKKIVDSKDFCIQCPKDCGVNQKWKEFIAYYGKKLEGTSTGYYYSPNSFFDGYNFCLFPESKTVLTLDQWWSVVHGEKLYTIQDLADGKVACVNDGTVEELRMVLKAAFPNDRESHGIWKYYYGNGIGSWNGSDVARNLPTQSVKDFVKQLEVNAWQPQPGEMVEIKTHEGWKERKFITMVKGWFACEASEDPEIPILWQHCRPIKQPITPTIEELKAAYAQVHGVDVERIKVKE